MASYMMFYSEYSDWPTRSWCFMKGGYSYGCPEEILGKIIDNLGRNEKLRHVEILGHGGGGGGSLSISNGPNPDAASTSIASGSVVGHDSGMRVFWMSLGQCMQKPGAIVLNMCQAGRNAAGILLLQDIAQLTGCIVYGALKDMTKEIGGNYYLDPKIYRRILPAGLRDMTADEIMNLRGGIAHVR